MALTNKLTAIANAIRAKTGTTNTLTLDEMPTAISNISSSYEPIIITANQGVYGLAGASGTYVINKNIPITFNDITKSNQMFYNNHSVDYSGLDITYKNDICTDISGMFQLSGVMKKMPTFSRPFSVNTGNNVFRECYNLREINESFSNNITMNYNNTSQSAWFNRCYSLRTIPHNLLSKFGGNISSSSNFYTYSCFYLCYCLDELVGLPIPTTETVSSGSSTFLNMVQGCNRLKRLTFATNSDGTAKTAKFKSATLDLSVGVGYADNAGNITSRNSGLTTATQITDATSYQSLKNNPDSWTTLIQYSRYNHDSAVETINSLPDTSAYGTNTIKFKGASGSATDGGAINTLTEAEIAVATAKGWTVSIV